MEETIDLRHSINVILRHWRLVVAIPIVAVLVAVVASFLSPATYQATAGVAIYKTRSYITFDPKYQTLAEEQLRSYTDQQSRQKAIVSLAKSGAVISEVLSVLGPSLPEEDRAPQGLRERVKTQSQGDLIEITVTHRDPKLAATLANTWSEVFERQINTIYASPVQLPEEIQLQLAQAKKSYDAAEEAVARFLGNNRIAELNREIAAKSKQISSYRDAEVSAQTKLALAKQRYEAADAALAQFLGNNRLGELERKIAINQTLLDDYYATRRRADALLTDARSFRSRLLAGDATINFRDSFSFLSLKANATTLTSGQLPSLLQLSMDVSNAGEEGREQILAEVDTLIANLETRLRELDKTTDIAQVRQEILEAQKQLDAEQQKKQELTHIRDRELGVYNSLQDELASLSYLSAATASKLIDQYGREVLQLQEQLEKEQAQQRELVQTRDLAWETYTTLTRKAAEANLAAQTKDTQIRFISPALVPTRPEGPRKLVIIALAGVIGVILGIVAAFAVDYLESLGIDLPTLRKPAPNQSQTPA